MTKAWLKWQRCHLARFFYTVFPILEWSVH